MIILTLGWNQLMLKVKLLFVKSLRFLQERVLFSGTQSANSEEKTPKKTGLGQYFSKNRHQKTVISMVNPGGINHCRGDCGTNVPAWVVILMTCKLLELLFSSVRPIHQMEQQLTNLPAWGYPALTPRGSLCSIYRHCHTGDSL